MFLIFGFSLWEMDCWTSLMGEVEACMVLNHLFPEQAVATYTHLMERGRLFPCFCTFHSLALFMVYYAPFE